MSSIKKINLGLFETDLGRDVLLCHLVNVNIYILQQPYYILKIILTKKNLEEISYCSYRRLCY